MPVSLARNSAAAEKNWNRKARAGKNSFPPTPFLFARPSNWILKFGIRIFFKKCSNINQETPHITIKTTSLVVFIVMLHKIERFGSNLLSKGISHLPPSSINPLQYLTNHFIMINFLSSSFYIFKHFSHEACHIFIDNFNSNIFMPINN